MCRDLDTIKGMFETQYAPMEWKASYTGWNLNSEIEYAKARVLTTPAITIKDYQSIVRDFFKSPQDFHVRVRFHSTESAYLPLKIKSAEGRYFITWSQECQLQVGDEVLKYNGQPIDEAVREFQLEEIGPGDTLTDRGLREVHFTNRYGAFGQRVPKGKAVFEIKSKSSGEESLSTLQWEYQEEGLKNLVIAPLKGDVFHLSFKTRKSSIYEKSMLSPYYDCMTYQTGEGLGDRESFIPALGKIIWSSEPDSFTHAYLFETPDGHRYGYIRIPTYRGNVLAFTQFKELIQVLEEESEGLVIDQLNNPGGSMLYAYALLSLLTDKPLITPTERITLTQREVENALSEIDLMETITTDEEAMEIFGDSLRGLPATKETAKLLLAHHRFILSQWNLGITVTSPYPLMGIAEIAPDKNVQYTKPILLLINHLDMSCGDIFPSILQDNKRATLLGTKTAGAGGVVLKAAYPNLFGINFFYYTGSIVYRSGNLPLENLGVTPDIEYEPTVEDLTNSYAPFKNKILEALKNQL